MLYCTHKPGLMLSGSISQASNLQICQQGANYKLQSIHSQATKLGTYTGNVYLKISMNICAVKLLS